MAEREPVSLDALNGLLKERQRYEEWLAALEDKRANTPDSVYQRVQWDYQTGLREVSSKLAERAGELRENIDALTSKLEEVSRQETQQREARQEAELRAAVGEYTDKQWKEIGGAWDKELARLVKEKSALETQLTELNRIFALSVKERQAEAIAMGRMPSEDGVRGGAGTPISPVVPRPAVPEPPTLTPPSRVEHPAGARQQTPAPTPGRSPFADFPVLRPGSGPASPPSTAARAPPPSPSTSGRGHPPTTQTAPNTELSPP